MSVRNNGASPESTTTGLSSKTVSRVVETFPNPWVRDPSWPPCEANVGDQKMVLLNAVYSARNPTASNFLAFFIMGGDFTVDFGDGTVTNYPASSLVDYQYSFDSPALSGTDAPVTLNATTDTVNRTAHGYTNGMTVTLYNVTSTPEVSSGQSFFVVNATANTFQISATSGGSPILFSVDGTATLLPYKIATITVTPQAGQSITTIDLDRRTASITNSYASNLLDVCIAFSTVTSITGYSVGFVNHRSIQRFRIIESSPSGTISFDSLCRDFSALQSVTINSTNANSVANMFNGCTSLVTAPALSLASVTTAASMFSACRSLQTVPSYTMPSCTNFSSMFANCARLRDVGAITGSSAGFNATSMFNTCQALVNAPAIYGKISNASSMFSTCTALVNIPVYDMSLATICTNMFNNCFSLRSVPLFDTQSVTDFSSMFNGCRALKKVPLFNTQSATNMSSMFSTCPVLEEVPLFNTQNVTNMTSMFATCNSLKKVPLFNTQNVTTMNNMFSGCVSLPSVPEFNTQSVTTMQSMFGSCLNLTTVPRFNTSRNVILSSMFSGCTALKSVPLFDTSLCTSLNTMFQNCVSLTDVPPFNLSAATTTASMFLGCNSLIRTPTLTATSALANASAMFQSCTSLTQVGPINLAGVTSSTNLNAIFQTCSSLSRVQAFGMRFSFTLSSFAMSKGSLEEVFDNLATVSTATVTVTGNYGIGASATAGTSSSTAGSTVINTVNTTGVVAGMLAVGTNCPVTSTVNGSADPATDTITAVAHGLNNGRKVSFSSTGVTTGLAQNTIYYVVNATTDTFQVSSTVGGAPINFGGSTSAVTFRYPNYVVSVNPGVSITMDAPQARTGTSTIQFRALDISSAIFKNWSVTL